MSPTERPSEPWGWWSRRHAPQTAIARSISAGLPQRWGRALNPSATQPCHGTVSWPVAIPPLGRPRVGACGKAARAVVSEPCPERRDHGGVRKRKRSSIPQRLRLGLDPADRRMRTAAVGAGSRSTGRHHECDDGQPNERDQNKEHLSARRLAVTFMHALSANPQARYVQTAAIGRSGRRDTRPPQ